MLSTVTRSRIIHPKVDTGPSSWLPSCTFASIVSFSLGNQRRTTFAGLYLHKEYTKCWGCTIGDRKGSIEHVIWEDIKGFSFSVHVFFSTKDSHSVYTQYKLIFTDTPFAVTFLLTRLLFELHKRSWLFNQQMYLQERHFEIQCNSKS